MIYTVVQGGPVAHHTLGDTVSAVEADLGDAVLQGEAFGQDGADSDWAQVTSRKQKRAAKRAARALENSPPPVVSPKSSAKRGARSAPGDRESPSKRGASSTASLTIPHDEREDSVTPKLQP